MATTLNTSSKRTTGHVFIATSVDGFIARPDGDIDWLTGYAATGEDTGYDAFMATIDGLVMGRATFEKVLSFDSWPFSKPVIVMSRTLSQGDVRAGLDGKVRISSLAPRRLMEALAVEGWRRAYVDGGQVIQSFLQDKLISDLVLTRVPVLLGEGLPLFGRLTTDLPLRHVETTTFASGLVQSRYELD
ncbi:dihydrofolate reductase family protein [Bradyrhizobium sp. 930_D9_N1_4]|uniref:dihydrofolate reductase family protein n=1 Tax=Bradyrhizobium sp. 930_D9_N1_4 TaxID=3240374 RepID=UPI003F886C03